jgi:anti-anti-sigma factor
MPTYINVDSPTVSAICEVNPPVLRISLAGELDMSSARLIDTLQELPVDGTRSVILDLSRLSFCDVAGVTALLALRAFHSSQGRDAQIAEPTHAVRRLLSVLHEDGLPRPPRGPSIDGANEASGPPQTGR